MVQFKSTPKKYFKKKEKKKKWDLSYTKNTMIVLIALFWVLYIWIILDNVLTLQKIVIV